MLAAGLVLVACAGESTTAEPPSTSTSSESGYVETEPSQVDACMQDGDIALELDGRGLEALAYGEGEVGVLLVHGVQQTPCSWDDFGRRLADAGFAVLAPSSGSNDPVADLQHGADWLLEQGATSIALVGASAGAAQSIVAATEIEPAPAGVVALSPPIEYSGADALAAMPDVTVPALLVAAPEDGDFASMTQTLAEAQPDAEVRIVDGGGHGTQLLEDDATAQAVIDLLESV